MAKDKFVFDPENLSYKQVNKGLKYKFLKLIIWIFSAFALGVAVIVGYSLMFDTPRERELRQENKSLSQDLEMLNERYYRIDTVLKELSYIDENIYRTIFETEPVSDFDSLRESKKELLELLKQENKVVVSVSTNMIDVLMKEISLNSQEYFSLTTYVSERENSTQFIPAIQPIENKDFSRLASGFGNRMHPYYKIVKFHSGMDFTAPTGTEVYATADGTVENLTRSGRGKGNTVVINHNNGYKTLYSHLDGFNLRKGRKVKRGDVIGWVGNTGLSVAPHLHYEVQLNGTPVNPINYYFIELSPENYNRMIELSIKSGQSFD